MSAIHEVKEAIDQMSSGIERWKVKQEESLKALRQEFESFAIKANRPFGLGGYSGGHGANGEARKALSDGVLALIAGDHAKANHCFAEAKAMSIGSGPDGGYVVHDYISSTMTKVMAEVSPVYRLARKVPIEIGQGDAFEEPIDAQAAGAVWVGETQSREDTSTPGLGLFRAPLHEISAMPKVTQRLIDGAGVDIVAWLSEKVGESFGTLEGSAFHIGDGIAKPRGLLQYPTSSAADSARAWGTVQHIATGTNGAFPTSSATVNPADVLVDVISAMKPQYRTGAVWLMNRNTAGAVRKLKDAEGRHVWVDSLVEGQPPILLGYRVEIDEDMPDIGNGSLSIAFANLEKGYTIPERPGIKFLPDPYTDKPNVRLYAYRRVGGGVNNSEAIKLLKFATS